MSPRPGHRDSNTPSPPRVLLAIIPLLGMAALFVLWRAPSMSRTPTATADTTTTSGSTVPMIVTTVVDPFDDQPEDGFVGALPDGTRFNINSYSGQRIGQIERVSGTIVVDVEQRPSFPQPAKVVGVVEYLAITTEFRDYGPGFVLLPAGEWTIRIDILDSAGAVLGDDPEQTLVAGIEVWTVNDMPALKLAPPLRWADDDEGPVPLEVWTSHFVVSRGCDADAASCSATRAVQLHLRDPIVGPSDPRLGVSVGAYEAPRPTTDAGYLNPGPLGFRIEPHLVWTGEELIVWGGLYSNNEVPFTGGAALDPATSAWRMLSEPPLRGPDLTAAVWADDRMLVIARQATLAYDPASDAWVRLGDGPPYVARSVGLTVWTGEVLATWASLGIHVFDPGEGVWTTLPDPGFGLPIRGGAALRVIGGRLFAIGAPCHRVAEWTGADWRPLPDLPGLPDVPEACPGPSQSGVVGGRLILWGGTEPAAAYDPVTDSWSPIPGPPGPIGDGSWDTGPLEMGDRLLVPVGPTAWYYYGESQRVVRIHSVLFDAATEEWLPVDLPGLGNEAQMVWTGEEVLAWGGCCWGAVPDAWRWRPPAG